MWLAAPLATDRGWDPSDMIATIRAEDDFDQLIAPSEGAEIYYQFQVGATVPIISIWGP